MIPSDQRHASREKQILVQKCEQIGVHDIECPVGFLLLNDAGYIDFARA